MNSKRFDAVLIGSGVMSATLATLINEINPSLKLLIIERLAGSALESSSVENNAGTGHAANCELNYTPMRPDGTIKIEKALKINASFERSLELWSSLAALGKIDPESFLKLVSHISFVWGDENVAFLRKRFDLMNNSLAFRGIEWSSEPNQMREWFPLIMEGRLKDQSIAATRINRGFDIDFGSLTNSYINNLVKSGSLEIRYKTEVEDLNQKDNGDWEVLYKDQYKSDYILAPYVFIGAGGRALSLLQKSGIPEGKNFGGFPVSGQWLTCKNKSLINNHNAKVYGMAKLGAPPMSVPHLDTRWINNKRSLLFGPFAGFSPKFLKEGSNWDLLSSITKVNFIPMLQAGISNINLIKYLIGQIQLSKKDRLDNLKEFVPKAQINDWELSIAGQRVQIIKKAANGGILQMGTQVVASKDGSLAALLGASPGASTAVSIMLEVLESSWSKKNKEELWKMKLSKLLPSIFTDILRDHDEFNKMRSRSNSFLNLI
mgnify:CR=1 FL=1|tara:strand:- start:6228 stop:7697 length:1470 start_codon:yes stop_codon:yes gene_type:complete